jgi:hypothetical protein
MRETGRRFTPAGGALAIMVTDVDLAGEVEAPVRPPQRCDRVYRDVYPLRIDVFSSTGLNPNSTHAASRDDRDARRPGVYALDPSPLGDIPVGRADKVLLRTPSGLAGREGPA